MCAGEDSNSENQTLFKAALQRLLLVSVSCICVPWELQCKRQLLFSLRQALSSPCITELSLCHVTVVTEKGTKGADRPPLL